jgi:ketosteroid isomerase-like protein
MKKVFALTAVAVLTTAALAQHVSDQPSRANQGARAELFEREKAFARTGAAKDIERFMSFTAESVCSFTAGQMVEGQEGFRQTWSKLFADPTLTIHWEPRIAEVSKSRDLGYTSGPYEFTSKDTQGNVVTRRGSFVTIWRKQPDGVWKVELDIGAPAPQEK